MKACQLECVNKCLTGCTSILPTRCKYACTCGGRPKRCHCAISAPTATTVYAMTCAAMLASCFVYVLLELRYGIAFLPIEQLQTETLAPEEPLPQHANSWGGRGCGLLGFSPFNRRRDTWRIGGCLCFSKESEDLGRLKYVHRTVGHKFRRTAWIYHDLPRRLSLLFF